MLKSDIYSVCCHCSKNMSLYADVIKSHAATPLVMRASSRYLPKATGYMMHIQVLALLVFLNSVSIGQ